MADYNSVVVTPYETVGGSRQPLINSVLAGVSFEDVTGHSLASGVPTKNLYVVEAALSGAQISQLKSDDRFFVLSPGPGNTGSALTNWLTGKGAQSHGVTTGDTEIQAISKLRAYCRGLGYEPAEADPADWYQVGDIGGAWRTKDVSTVSRSDGDLAIDAPVNAITSQWPTGTQITTAGWHLLWGGDHIKADAAITGGAETGRFLQASVGNQAESAGLMMMACFSFTGTCNLDSVDGAWLENHKAPQLLFVNGAGTIQFLPTRFDTDAVWTTPDAYNDGQKHTFGFRYDPVSEEITYWIDGVKVRTKQSGVALGAWDTPALICGKRAGIDQRGYGLIARNRAGSDEEMAAMSAWLLA